MWLQMTSARKTTMGLKLFFNRYQNPILFGIHRLVILYFSLFSSAASPSSGSIECLYSVVHGYRFLDGQGKWFTQLCDRTGRQHS